VDIAERLKIGTSGYSFRDWAGPFYPEKIKPGAMLEYYSKFFDITEINATYYRIPPRSTFRSMDRATDDDFRFVVKLHGSMTHERKGDLQPFDDLKGAVQPLCDSGKMLGFLAQFPYSFRNTADNRSYLEWLRLKFADSRFFAEFRHESWMYDGLFEYLKNLNIGYCSVDEPALAGLIPPVAEATDEYGYVRFHGRNTLDWWKPRPGSDRYLYDYSEGELKEWIPRIEKLAGGCSRVLMFFNNCHFGNAPRNALNMKRMMGIKEMRIYRKGELKLEPDSL